MDTARSAGTCYDRSSSNLRQPRRESDRGNQIKQYVVISIISMRAVSFPFGNELMYLTKTTFCKKILRNL